MKLVLAQNAEQIKKLSKENFLKSQIILQQESEKPQSKSLFYSHKITSYLYGCN